MLHLMVQIMVILEPLTEMPMSTILHRILLEEQSQEQSLTIIIQILQRRSSVPSLLLQALLRLQLLLPPMNHQPLSSTMVRQVPMIW